MNSRTIFIFLIIILVGIAACTQQQSGPADDTTTSQEDNTQYTTNEKPTEKTETSPTEPVGEETATESSVKEFTIEAKQWEFVPSTITVNQGDTVRLYVTSTDVEHGLAIPEFSVNENLPPGEEVTIEFTADKAGTFRMFCSVYCGPGHSSMTGTLVVQ